MEHQGKYIEKLYRSKGVPRKQLGYVLHKDPSIVNKICKKKVVEKDILIAFSKILGEDLILHFYPEDIDHLLLAKKLEEAMKRIEFLENKCNSLEALNEEQFSNFNEQVALYEKKISRKDEE